MLISYCQLPGAGYLHLTACNFVPLRSISVLHNTNIIIKTLYLLGNINHGCLNKNISHYLTCIEKISYMWKQKKTVYFTFNIYTNKSARSAAFRKTQFTALGRIPVDYCGHQPAERADISILTNGTLDADCGLD